uniref:Uncharacterized protein n=1 Tax=Arundo donax TaxID=35708 RepID=A0A0A8ZDQ2_ARUDO
MGGGASIRWRMRAGAWIRRPLPN